MIKMNEEIIKKSLKYYHIKNKDYTQKCMSCLERRERNAKLKEKVIELKNEMLEDDHFLKKIWNFHDLDEMLDESSLPFLTNIILLSTYDIVKKNTHNFSRIQIKLAKKRIRESLLNDILKRGYKSIRLSQMLWGIYFVKGRIIEIGKLQYEISFVNPMTETEEKVIKIHIPKGKSLNIKEVNQYLKKASKKIKKYFHLNSPNYYCNSWLLSKEILKLLDKDANIVKFSKLFTIKEGEECTSDILNFVFEINECKNYNDLSQNTSLQKKIKTNLIEGTTFHLGIGLLKK